MSKVLGDPLEDDVTCASPPCFMREVDPAYLGILNRDELVVLLNQLLEGERAGARGAREMSQRTPSSTKSRVLRRVAEDEAGFCAMLARHIRRLRGIPSMRTGAFYSKLAATEPGKAQMDLLNRGQGWVVRELRKVLCKIDDQSLRQDLTHMLHVHQQNITKCTEP